MKAARINNKIYTLQVSKTPEELEKGLSGVKVLPKDSGMLFDLGDIAEEVSFWMENTHIPLKIVFLDKDMNISKVCKGLPNTRDSHIGKNVRYVIEVDADEDIEEGDDVDLIDDPDKMLVLDPEGDIQMVLKSGERIFSRKNTKNLIRLAKLAEEAKDDASYEKLGKAIFRYLDIQDKRGPQYVEEENKKGD